MALTATIYHFEIDLSDVDRSVYQLLDLRLAQHPSESMRFMLARAIAYCLFYDEGIEPLFENFLAPQHGFRAFTAHQEKLRRRRRIEQAAELDLLGDQLLGRILQQAHIVLDPQPRETEGRECTKEPKNRQGRQG